jgi:hypothetical protein
MRPLRVAVLLGVVALAGIVPAASADTELSPRQATSITAFDGARVWDEPRSGGEWALYLRRSKRTSRLGSLISEQPFAPDLGPRQGGGVTAVYKRCPNSDYDCAIYSLRIGGRAERAEGRIHKRGCEEQQPTYWRGTIAFIRAGRSFCKPGVYVRGRRGAARRISSFQPDSLDLRDRTILWHDDDNDCGSGGADPVFCDGTIVTSSVGTLSFSGRRTTLASAIHRPGTPDAAEVRIAGLDGGFAYYTLIQGDQFGQTSPLRTKLVRQPASGGATQEADVSLTITSPPRSVAVAGRAFAYVSNRSPFQPFEADVFPF